MSLCLDASAALALHFNDEYMPFESLEERLSLGEAAYTAPNFHQEVMEVLRRAIREGRTTKNDANAWLNVLDSYTIIPVPLFPLAGSATWLWADNLNISAYDAGYVAVAYMHGLPLWTKDIALTKKLKRVGIQYFPDW